MESRKNCISVPKGVVHNFGQKIENFSWFYFSQNRQGKCVWRNSPQKKAFLDIKKINFKNSKKLHFSKWVSPWFSSKIWDFSFFYFWKSRREKCVWRYCQSKNSLFRLKKTLILKTRNKCIFPKGLVHGFGQKIDFFFHLFVFRQNKQGKFVWRRSREQKKCFQTIKIQIFKK